MVSIVSALGAGSGIDTQDLVSQLVEAERAPAAQRLDTRQSEIEAQISAYGSLRSTLSDFQSSLSSLANPDTFTARSVAFPNSDVITPNSLDAGAQTGSYRISVDQVATAQTLVMGTSSGAREPLGGSGTLSIQFGNWSYDETDPDNPIAQTFALDDSNAALEIDIDASDTLTSIANKINNSDSGVQASVLNVGSEYRLMLTAPSGESNAMMITGTDDGTVTGAGSDLLSNFSFNESNFAAEETLQGQDAILRVNGLEVHRDTNTIDDIIEGFDFTINRTSEPGDAVNFSIDGDESIAEDAIRNLVDSYNTFLDDMSKLTDYNSDEEDVTIGALSHDSSAKTLVRQLRSLMTSQVDGLEGGFSALTNLGIRTELDGTLSIDEDEFTAALSDNYDQVAALFSQQLNSSSTYVTVGAGSSISSAAAGSYDLVVTQDPTHGDLKGGAVTHNFGAGILDASAEEYSFRANVDGTLSGVITLNGQYSSLDELRADLQTKINGDSNLSAVNAKVDVSIDNGQLVFTSREYGTASTVSFNNRSAAMDNIGLGANSGAVSSNGLNVQGTINGEAAYGSGNVLLPSIGSEGYGLNFTIQPGAAAAGSVSIDFSRGIAGSLDRMIGQFLADDGLIDHREQNLDRDMDNVDSQRERLDSRIESYQARLSSQFLAMEQIVDSLNATADSVAGLIDQLPFTAQSN